jgi:chromosome condensin MukBEF MukE localization factor
MLRSLVCALFGLVICASVLLAEEVRGTVARVDGKSLEVKVGDEVRKFKLADDVKVMTATGKDFKGGVEKLKADTEVTLTVDGETIKEIRVASKKKKDQN